MFCLDPALHSSHLPACRKFSTLRCNPLKAASPHHLFKHYYSGNPGFFWPRRCIARRDCVSLGYCTVGNVWFGAWKDRNEWRKGSWRPTRGSITRNQHAAWLAPCTTNRHLSTEHVRMHAHLSFTKSSGPGGQNVNKVNTKAECRFHIGSAHFLSEDVKARLRQQCANRINKDDEIVIMNQTHREQTRNAEEAIKKLIELIRAALVAPKQRVIRVGRTEKGERERKEMKDKQKDRKDSRRSDWKKSVF